MVRKPPLTGLYGQRYVTDAPVGYGFDFLSADALLRLISVRGGNLVTPSGMRYRVLQLGGSSMRMTLPVLRKLDELVRAGAIVIGKKPVSSPSLADDPDEFRRLADGLWSGSASAAGGSVVCRPRRGVTCWRASVFLGTGKRGTPMLHL